MRHIDSPKNAEIKALLKLKERRGREREGHFLIEGRREIERAAQANVRIKVLYLCPSMPGAAGLEKLRRELEVTGLDSVELSPAAFERVSMRENPDGTLAVAEAWQRVPEDLELRADALVLVVDGLEKPGNLGALLRTADSAGVDAVFVTGAGTDLFNPNVIRASMGSLFARPVMAVDSGRLRDWLARREFRVVATSPAATTTYWDADLRSATAIVLGTEHEGLPEHWLDCAAELVTVPMHGLADSLNVATTGALLLYEALRQRR